MRIGGLQKTTMLDFPGKVSAVVFTQGCNFLCPYCHNPDLVMYGREPLPLAEVMAFLAQRKKVLEGVVISGGEPTLHDGLFSFCATLKGLGYAVKLDTNGSRPDILRLLLQSKLLDYVAMDVKANPHQYPVEISPGNLGDAITQSIALLEDSTIAHEFRVPCLVPFMDVENFSEILKCIFRRREQNKTPLFLQKLKIKDVLRPDFFEKEGRPLTHEEIVILERRADEAGVICHIR